MSPLEPTYQPETDLPDMEEIPEEAVELEPIVAYRNVERSRALEEELLEGTRELSEVHPRITSCRITLEQERQGRQSGDLFSVRIDLTVPGGEIVVNRTPPEREENEDLLVAVRGAFESARRKLREHARIQRGQVKAHVEQARGHVVRLMAGEGYGFLEGDDGREFYFHENSVLGKGYEALEVGSEVRFTEGRGEEGPSATTVIPTGAIHPID